jgi:uncharacterized paraquat-inducible protein A
VPGLVLDILKIDITASFFVEINLFNESRSVFGTLRALWEAGAWLAFSLILLFGLIVPVAKSIIVFYILAGKNVSPSWYRAVSLSSKWAMADVFAISIFIAFLGANAMKYTTAVLEPGFYFFAAYVLLSAFIVGFLGKMNNAVLSNQA